jgi:hypothetical protein
MNDAKLIPLKLLIALIVPLLMVTLGGFITYHNITDFFFPNNAPGSAEVNGPAVIYYALTLVIALMFFLMKQGYKGYEFIALGVLSLVYSISLQKLTPQVQRLLILYFVPLLVFFLLMWLILKFIFLNKAVRSTRLLLFALLSSAAFTIAFWLQMQMLKQLPTAEFLQGRFFSGLMLFIFMGFGLSIADFMMYKLDMKKASPITANTDLETTTKPEGSDETD